MNAKTPLKIYNSLSGNKEIFEPDNSENVTMYVCGPTVYDRAHIGNLRSAIVFDVIFRTLRHVYGENHVIFVRNYTDIDDKIINKSLTTGTPLSIITTKAIAQYEDDLDSLGTLVPTFTPKVTEHIENIIEFIQTLLNAGFAYEKDNHVFFSVDKFPDYGKLSGITQENKVELSSSFSIKNNEADFVLWKPVKDKEQNVYGANYNSPWSYGRPGWHIECSAMSKHFFGDKMDIHGGGIDLKFPHHENEIAQSECNCANGPMSRFWLHNEMVTIDGVKMGKSYNNVLTLENMDVSPALIRFIMMKTHYRKILNWKQELTTQSEKEFKKLSEVREDGEIVIDNNVEKMLYNDFNVPGVIARAHRLYKENRWIELSAINTLLGIGDS